MCIYIYIVILFRLFMNCFLISWNFRMLHGFFFMATGSRSKVFSWVFFFVLSVVFFLNPFQDSALEALVSGGPPRNFRAPPTGTIRNPEPKPALALKTIKQDLFVEVFSFFSRQRALEISQPKFPWDSLGFVSFGLRLKPRQIPLQNPKKSQPKQALSVEDRSILPGIRFALLLG